MSKIVPFNSKVIVWRVGLIPAEPAYIYPDLDAAIRSIFNFASAMTDENETFVYTSRSYHPSDYEPTAYMNAYNFYWGDWTYIDPLEIVARAEELAEAWRNRPSFRMRNAKPFVFRKGPVPGIHKRSGGRGRFLRYPATMQERRENSAIDYDGELLELKLKVRGRRSSTMLPTAWDDIVVGDHSNYSWKRHRRFQWKS